MYKNIKKTIKKIITILKQINFIPVFVFFGFFGCLVSSILILIFSRHIIFPPRLDYIGFNNFYFYFSVPIKLLIGSTTLFGINLAYKAHKLNKKTFFLINKPVINIENLNIEYHKNFTYPFKISFLIINHGNLPAKNISIISSLDIDIFKDSKHYTGVCLLKDKQHSEIFVLNKSLSEKIISKDKIILKFDVFYNSTNDIFLESNYQYKYIHSQKLWFPINEYFSDI